LGNELRGLKRTIEHGAPTKPPPSDKIASIAVLPFVNRSASSDDEYFSDGLADELLNVLTKIRGLRVAARTSAFHFKGKDTTIAEVGQALHVDTVLEGTVRKAGQRVRIAVQLVKVSDGYHLWSESYDRTLDDILALQDDIAQSVVKELRRTLLGEEADSKASGEVKAEISQAARGRTTYPEVYRLCLQARHLLGRFTRTDTAKAIEYLKHALELDPDFALGWAELSRAYSAEAARGWVPVTEGFSRARQAADLALELEPGLGEAHSALGWIQQVHDWDWQGAETSYRRAMELSPGNTTVLRRAGVLAAALGQFEEAMALFHRAIDGDPLDSSSYHNLGLVLAASDRIEESEQAFRKALELATQRSTTHAYLSLSLLLMGRQEEALEVVKKEPNEGDRLPAQSIIEGALGNLPEADRLLRQLIETRAESEPSQIAEVYATRGEKDEAFAWLERAFGARDAGVTLILQSPRLRSLHADPRWRALLEKLELAK
jgi:TolB-like protein/Tfp pilus assembly protein PilF